MMRWWVCVLVLVVGWGAWQGQAQAQISERALGARVQARVQAGPTRLSIEKLRAPQTRSTPALGTHSQALQLNADLLTAGLIVLIPTIAIELTLFIGNLAAFSLNKRLLEWGIQGVGFALLGTAVTIPWIALGLDSGLAISFIALHVVLLGISVTNIVLDIQRKPRKVAWIPWGGYTRAGGAQGGIACVGKF